MAFSAGVFITTIDNHAHLGIQGGRGDRHAATAPGKPPNKRQIRPSQLRLRTFCGNGVSLFVNAWRRRVGFAAMEGRQTGVVQPLDQVE
jgi:hypothetical protein